LLHHRPLSITIISFLHKLRRGGDFKARGVGGTFPSQKSISKIHIKIPYQKSMPKFHTIPKRWERRERGASEGERERESTHWGRILSHLIVFLSVCFFFRKQFELSILKLSSRIASTRRRRRRRRCPQRRRPRVGNYFRVEAA